MYIPSYTTLGTPPGYHAQQYRTAGYMLHVLRHVQHVDALGSRSQKSLGRPAGAGLPVQNCQEGTARARPRARGRASFNG